MYSAAFAIKGPDLVCFAVFYQLMRFLAVIRLDDKLVEIYPKRIGRAGLAP